MRGVLYFNKGSKCLVRLLVSLMTLRNYWHGSVAIVAEGDQPPWFKDITRKLNASIITVPQTDGYILASKSKVWRHSPFDTTLFLDADTLIRGPVDDLFELIEDEGCMVTNFNGWHTHRGRMARRIKEWRHAFPRETERALLYGLAINTGIFGWVKGAKIMPRYEEMTIAGLNAKVGRKTVDELAMQLLLPDFPHNIAGPEWNTGCLHGDYHNAKIVHYHGNKHCREGKNGDLWKEEFFALCNIYPEHKWTLTHAPLDPSVKAWLQADPRITPGRVQDITIVTAVNPAYADKAKANIALWLKTPGLREQRFLVFVAGFKSMRERKFLNHPNVTVVRWDYQFDCTERERMLASFTLGTARHVKTKYWMKLDCDTKPVREAFEWPSFDGFAVVSHRWGYTKIKSDKEAKEHWFTKLDRIFNPGTPLFKPLHPVRDIRVSHRKGNVHGVPMRFASFAHIERSDFTRRIAELIKSACGGRLPIPSHDTLVWYLATLWKQKVKLINMKEHFNPR